MTNLISIKDTDDFLKTSIFSDCHLNTDMLMVSTNFPLCHFCLHVFHLFSVSHLQMNTFNHYKQSLYGLDIHYIKVPAKQGQYDELTLYLAEKNVLNFTITEQPL